MGFEFLDFEKDLIKQAYFRYAELYKDEPKKESIIKKVQLTFNWSSSQMKNELVKFVTELHNVHKGELWKNG